MRPFGSADLEKAYARLEKPLYNVVLRTVWDREEAHDLVQEAFARLWAMRSKVDPETVDPLAYRIALNLARSIRRKRRVRRFLGLEALAATLGSGPEGEREILAGERTAEVREAIESLPRDVRDVVLLTSFAELGYREIAAILGIPEGTVGSRRNRGLRMLRDRLREVHDERPA